MIVLGRVKYRVCFIYSILYHIIIYCYFLRAFTVAQQAGWASVLAKKRLVFRGVLRFSAILKLRSSPQKVLNFANSFKNYLLLVSTIFYKLNLKLLLPATYKSLENNLFE